MFGLNCAAQQYEHGKSVPGWKHSILWQALPENFDPSSSIKAELVEGSVAALAAFGVLARSGRSLTVATAWSRWWRNGRWVSSCSHKFLGLGHDSLPCCNSGRSSRPGPGRAKGVGVA